MFTIAICDDNKQDCSNLCNMVEQYFCGKQKIELHSFQSGLVLYQFMKSQNVHLVIMDIMLDNHSGIYFEVSGHNTTICLNDGTEQTCYISLKEIERKLNQATFLRCHRSFIVNMKHVSRYERSSLQLDDKHMISIGKKYEKDVRQRLMSYWKDVI